MEDLPVPESLKAVSWCDGTIGQLQNILFQSRETEDEKERICRNKQSAAATGTQQLCDLAPIFRILRKTANTVTVKDDIACGLADTIQTLFSTKLRKKGLNLDGNYQNKRALIDFLVCLPEMLKASLKKKHIKQGFLESGMIEEATGTASVFEKLLGTCKQYVLLDSDVGIRNK